MIENSFSCVFCAFKSKAKIMIFAPFAQADQIDRSDFSKFVVHAVVVRRYDACVQRLPSMVVTRGEGCKQILLHRIAMVYSLF